jgi:glucose-6-phosphate 1-dehydrogenase
MAVRKIKREEVHSSAVRGQYGAGWIEGKKVKGYRQEPGVERASKTETFAAIKLYIDNWRWQGVPFYLRTGKRMNDTISVITIQFRPVPHQSFPHESMDNWESNRLILNIQPNMGIRLRFQSKRPGLKMLLNPVDMLFDYYNSYATVAPEAYETLLYDIIIGDATLFMCADQVEAAWSILMPIIEAWEVNTTVKMEMPGNIFLMKMPAQGLIGGEKTDWQEFPMLNVSFALHRLFGMERTLIS